MAQGHLCRDSIVFFGSPLIDITARVDINFLEKYKLEPDRAYAVDENNREIFDEIRSISSVQIGGSVTNSIRAFTKLRPRPHLVTYLGTVGRDELGQFIKKGLEENLGCDLSQVEEETGKVAVLLNGKSRTLITDLGASRIFSLDDEKWSKINSSDFIYLSGFFIGVSYSTTVDIIEKAGKILIFNLGAPFLCTKYPEEMIHIYRNSSIIFGNESEHHAFARINNITSSNLKEAVSATANHLLPSKSRVIVVTRGPESVLVLHNSDWLEFEVPLLTDDKIVDTSGAGDAFVGGFLASYLEGDSVANCVSLGIKIAIQVVQSVGFNI